MQLNYQRATIGFVVDLTSPDSEVIPVANLLVGDAEGRRVAGVAWHVPDALDPFAKAMLIDVDQLVRPLVDEAFDSCSSAVHLGDVLARVDHALRNNVRVSAIHESSIAEVSSVPQLGGAVLHLLCQGVLQTGFPPECLPEWEHRVISWGVGS